MRRINVRYLMVVPALAVALSLAGSGLTAPVAQAAQSSSLARCVATPVGTKWVMLPTDANHLDDLGAIRFTFTRTQCPKSPFLYTPTGYEIIGLKGEAVTISWSTGTRFMAPTTVTLDSRGYAKKKLGLGQPTTRRELTNALIVWRDASGKTYKLIIYPGTTPMKVFLGGSRTPISI